MRFIPFQEPHTDLLLEWLAKPHVSKFWQEEGARDQIWARYRDFPKRHVHPFVFEIDGRIVGYIQYYDAAKVGGGWWADEKPGAFGIDLMIGDESLTGRNIGPNVIREFMAFVAAREPALTNFIIDPEPANVRAIRAYEKVGFRKEKNMTTPNGAAVLMRFIYPRSKAT